MNLLEKPEGMRKELQDFRKWFLKTFVKVKHPKKYWRLNTYGEVVIKRGTSFEILFDYFSKSNKFDFPHKRVYMNKWMEAYEFPMFLKEFNKLEHWFKMLSRTKEQDEFSIITTKDLPTKESLSPKNIIETSEELSFQTLCDYFCVPVKEVITKSRRLQVIKKFYPDVKVHAYGGSGQEMVFVVKIDKEYYGFEMGRAVDKRNSPYPKYACRTVVISYAHDDAYQTYDHIRQNIKFLGEKGDVDSERGEFHHMTKGTVMEGHFFFYINPEFREKMDAIRAAKEL